jgi:hypothetical protein
MLVQSAVFVVASLVVTVGNASATGATDVLNVNVPFPFVVRGESFPAGQYRIERSDLGSAVVLIHGEKGNTATAFVATEPAKGHAPAGDMPALQFTKHENEYRLTNIWESTNEGQKVLN